MGRTVYELRATASLSRHNSPQDDRDNDDWNRFVHDVRLLANQAFDLYIDVHAEDGLPTDQWGED